MTVEVEVVFELLNATVQALIAVRSGRRSLRFFSLFTDNFYIFGTVNLFGPYGVAAFLFLSSVSLLVVIIIDFIILIIFSRSSGAELHYRRALELLTRR
jgi:hypothetical protein